MTARPYKHLPDTFLACILQRKHTIPYGAQARQHVRLIDGKYHKDLTEFSGTCAECGTVRILLRDRYSGGFWSSQYAYPEGYLAQPGQRWDRSEVFREYQLRNPAPSSVRKVEVPAGRL